MIGQVITFVPVPGREGRSARRAGEAGGTVLLFTGVRYERMIGVEALDRGASAPSGESRSRADA